MNTVVAFVALVLIIPSTVLASSAWTVSTGSAYCTGAFTVSNVAFTCDNGQECGFGSNVKVTGYLNAKTTLPQSATITAQGCVYSMFCKTVFTESGVDLCAGNVLSPQYDQTCPSAGLYRISTSFNLPSNSNAANLLSGKTVTVKATIAGSDSSTTCSFQATASNGSAYQMSWGSMAAASLVFVALGAYGIRRRRRSMAQIDLDAAEDQLPSSDFELMKSSPLPHVTMA